MKNNSLIKKYHQYVERGDIEYSTSQVSIIHELDIIKDHLEKKKSIFSFFDKIPLGVYLWGDVGRGKTFLSDLFYDNLNTKKKLRLHFNSFMVYLHNELKQLKQVENPLVIIAKKIKNRTDILFFDEFFVSDIADAMLLGKLIGELFKIKIILISTSNIHPDNLYKGGLQRSLFLPAIKELKDNCKIFFIDIEKDFRLRNLEKVNLFYISKNESSKHLMYKIFLNLVKNDSFIKKNAKLIINNRSINTKCKTENIVWFNFLDICDGPRSSHDYVEISKIFNTVFISDIHVMTSHDEEKARRFVSLIDELYDHNVNLVISSEKEIHEIYEGSQLRFSFKRTLSRLIEMQSKEYLSKAHII